MAPKTNTKKKAEDDDDKFLDEQMAVAAAAAKSLAAENAAALAKQAERQRELAKAQEAERLARAKAAQDLPPIFVDDVAKKVVEISQNCNLTATSSTKLGQNHMSDMCWIAYVINNFLSFAVENHRYISMRTILQPHGEKVVSFEVHDDRQPNEQHSWNVITVGSGSYAIDVTLEQFIPSGRYGYRRDAKEEDGWIPVKGSSRLLAPQASGAAPTPLVGLIAVDGGILPEGPVVVEGGVAEGTYKKYLRFLSDAHSGRFNKMSAAERRAGEILFKNKAVPQWLKLHEKLIEHFFAQ